MKKRWSSLEFQLKELKNISPPHHLKQQILNHAIKLTRIKLTLIDKLWASFYLRSSFIVAIVILIFLGSISDWRVNQKMTSSIQEELDTLAAEENLLAAEIGLDHWEDLQKIKSHTIEENAKEEIWKFLEKKKFQGASKNETNC